jgi:hypothetical protein
VTRVCGIISASYLINYTQSIFKTSDEKTLVGFRHILRRCKAARAKLELLMILPVNVFCRSGLQIQKYTTEDFQRGNDSDRAAFVLVVVESTLAFTDSV